MGRSEHYSLGTIVRGEVLQDLLNDREGRNDAQKTSDTRRIVPVTQFIQVEGTIFERAGLMNDDGVLVGFVRPDLGAFVAKVSVPGHKPFRVLALTQGPDEALRQMSWSEHFDHSVALRAALKPGVN